MKKEAPKNNNLYKKLQQVSRESTIDKPSEEILNIVQLILYKDKQLSLAELLSSLGTENFIRLLYIVGGKTVTFPTPNEFKDVFTWALTYYAKEVQGMSWKDIKNQLGQDQSSIKWSSKNKQLNKFIQNALNTKLAGESLEEYLRKNIRP